MIYYVESYSGWYLVKANNKRDARSDGVHEFGRGYVKSVRLATDEEIEYYTKAMKRDIPESERYTEKAPAEE